MASVPSTPLQLEIAHVLFMDLVGYSRLSLGDQAVAQEKLRGAARGTEQFRRAEARDELICLPRGDGMALVFLRNPVAPVQCAEEIARSLRDDPKMRLRMGVHSGPVCLVENINADRDLAGSGINLAERVM